MKWSDGEPLTAADIAYTYNRVLDGGPEGATWSSYLAGVESVTAPDATTVVLKLKKPNAVLPLLPIPIVPEHVWKDVPARTVKSYGAEPEDGSPWSAPGRSGSSRARRAARRTASRRTPTTGRAPRTSTEVVFRVYKSEDPPCRP